MDLSPAIQASNCFRWYERTVSWISTIIVASLGPLTHGSYTCAAMGRGSGEPAESTSVLGHTPRGRGVRRPPEAS